MAEMTTQLAQILSVNEPFKVQSTLPSYTLKFVSLVSNEILTEIPAGELSYSFKLNGIGTLSCSFIYSREFININLSTNTAPGRIGTYLFRNDTLVWGGIITKRSYTRPDGKISLECESFESYFYRRFQKVSRYFADTDQMTIGRWLFEQLGPSNSYQNMFMTTNATKLSGKKRDRNFFSYEFKTLGEELEALSGLIGSFDWEVKVYDNGVNYIRELIFGYPQLGASRNTTQLVFEYPTNIVAFTFDENAVSMSTAAYAIGAGEGLGQLSQVAYDDSYRSATYPIYESSRSYKSVLSPSTLQEHATRDLEDSRPPNALLDVTINGSIFPTIMDVRAGDWARFRISDPWFDAPIDEYYRILEINVNASTKGTTETYTLVLDRDGNTRAGEDPQGADAIA